MTEGGIERSSLLARYQDELQEKIRGRQGTLLYRGQKYAEWKLQSGATGRINNDPVQSDVLIQYHNALLEPARLRGWNRDSSGRKLEDLELLAKLQHHGAATCLLDFTTRFDIALWFACQEVSDQEVKKADQKKPKKGRVFIIAIDQNPQWGLGKVHSDELEKKIDYFLHPESRLTKVQNETDSQMSENSEELRQLKEERDKIRFWYWEPETLMGRMLSQESRFLFGPQDIPEDAYFYIDIREEHKENLLRELIQQQGLRPETVFSDIHGFADINARGKPWKIKSYEDYMRSGMNKLQERGELTSAIEDFDEAVKLKPDSVDAWFYSGIARVRIGRHEEAIKKFDEVIKLDADFVAAWFHRGSAKMELKRYEGAIADYDEAIKLDGGFARAWLNRGLAKIELKRYEDALTDHDKAIKLDADDAIAWHCRGSVKMKLGRYEDAIADYDEAIKLDGGLAVSWHYRGSAKMKLGRYKDAIADYDEAIKLAANFAVTWFERGAAKAKLGCYEAARSDMEEALVLFQKRKNQKWQKRVKKCIKKLDELLEKKDEPPDS